MRARPTVATIIVAVLLVPGFAHGQLPWIGVFFDTSYHDMQKNCQGIDVVDTLHIVLVDADAFVSGVEFAVNYPPEILFLADIGKQPVSVGNTRDGFSQGWAIPPNGSLPVYVCGVQFLWKCDTCVGENIPIPTTRLQTADTGTDGFQTSQNIERQDVGVTLRVTPQISEGDTIRLQIFQEISEVLSEQAELGPTTSRRTVENTVYVRNGEAVMIGGILSETETESVGKVPFLGDIPILGWAFKSVSNVVRKTNLLVILTPHIVRDPGDLNRLTVEHRERFRDSAAESLEFDEDQESERAKALAAGLELPRDPNPVRRQLETRQLGNKVQSAIDTVMLEVQVSVREIRAAFDEMVGQYEAMSAARVEMDVLEQRRSLILEEGGRGSQYLEDVLRAQVDVARSEDGFARSLATYNVALVNLERARGTLLKSHGIMVARLYDHLDMLREILELYRQIFVLSVNISNL